MADKPGAEIRIDDSTVRGLLRQAPDLIPDPHAVALARVDGGWDCEIWRVGPDRAVRLPRRAVAAPLIRHEQTALPAFAGALAATGVSIPVPLFVGQPDEHYPWAWSIVPWIRGASGLDVPRRRRAAWAPRVARFLDALHRPATGEYPLNPVRGVPLRARADAVGERLAGLASHPRLARDTLRRAVAAWQDGLDAPTWHGPPTWLHGDLHPGNIVVDDDALVGVIDFGDVTAGDPACDLAIAWLAFDAPGRRRLHADLGSGRSDADWARARAWAVGMASSMLAHSDDDPRYGVLGLQSLHEVSSD